MIPGTDHQPPATDPSWSTLARYALLQIPALIALGSAAGILWELGFLSGRVAGGLFALWVLKDIVAYPFVRRAYERRGGTPVEDLVGARGEVQQPLAPAGYVSIGRELWRAEVGDGAAHVPVGREVIVRGTRGLTLIVDPAEGNADAGSNRPPDRRE